MMRPMYYLLDSTSGVGSDESQATELTSEAAKLAMTVQFAINSILPQTTSVESA